MLNCSLKKNQSCGTGSTPGALKDEVLQGPARVLVFVHFVCGHCMYACVPHVYCAYGRIVCSPAHTYIVYMIMYTMCVVHTCAFNQGRKITDNGKCKTLKKKILGR